MKELEIYFGEHGLTSTSANNIANRAKELVSKESNRVQNISLVNESITLASVATPVQTKVGTKDLNSVKTDALKIAAMHSLIAWLREAIKAREEMCKEVEKIDMDEYVKIKGVDALVAPERPAYPEREEYPEEEDIIATLDIGTRCRMLTLEAKAAALAEIVGPRGSLNKARKEMYRTLAQPAEVRESSQGLTVYSYSPSVEDTADVDSVFFDLEKEWTDANSELNGIKHTIEEKIKSEQRRIDAEYEEAMTAYQEAVVLYEEYVDAYNDTIRNLRNEMAIYKREELERIESLKIIIPNNIKNIYEEVQSVTKK